MLSFGVSKGISFDSEISSESSINCLTHSFDPYFHDNKPDIIEKIKKSKKNALSIRLNKDWYFHKIGLATTTVFITSEKNEKYERLDSLKNLLSYLSLDNVLIDYFKLDLNHKGLEFDVMTHIMDENMNLLCNNVKQIGAVLSPYKHNITHNYKVIKRLEKCFRLFRRDQHFFFSYKKTEWQLAKSTGYEIDLQNFKNDIELAKVLFTYGKLYFVNMKFLKI